jgi:chromosomal replication initiation ATPase DnaA
MSGAYISIETARQAYAQVSAESGISMEMLLSRHRWRKLVRARWRVMQIMRDQNASLPMIALRMGLHHTTVMHGLRQSGCA